MMNSTGSAIVPQNGIAKPVAAPATPSGGWSTADFANSIRTKFPAGVTSDGKTYSSMSDGQLVDRIVQKYPTYQTQIHDYHPVSTSESSGASVRPGNSLADAGRDISSFGHAVVSNEVNAGQDIAAALGAPRAAAQLQNLSAQDAKFVSTVIQLRNEARAEGKDTSHWDTILQNYKPHDSQETLKEMFPALNKTNEQVVGDFAGVATDIASAGALEGGVKGATAVGKGIGAGIKEGAAAGAKGGAIVGGGQGFSDALQSNKDSEDVVKDTAQGAAIGAGAGAFVGGGVGALGNEVAPKVESAASGIGPDGGSGPGKAKSIVTETVRRVGKNIANFAEDAQTNAAARDAIRSKGPAAVNVLDETGSPEFVNNIDKTSNVSDLQTKQKMLAVAAEHPKVGGSGSVTSLPRQVIANEYIAPRVDMLQSRLGQLGKTIGAAKEDVTRVKTNDLVDSMINEAKKQGVLVKPGGTGFRFSKVPGVSGIDKSRINTIKSMFDGFKSDKNGNFSNTRAQLAQTRKNLSELTSRADAAREVVSAGGAVDNTRRAIAKKIGGDYYKATVDYHDLASVLGKLDPDLGVTLSDEGAKNVSKIKMSDYARRLLSNNASQAKAVFTSLDELAQKEAARTGKKLSQQNLEDLVDTAGAIEEGLGITPRNSFFGQISGAQKSAMGGIPTSVGEAVGKVKDILTKSEAHPGRALKAMRAYVDQAIKNHGS